MQSLWIRASIVASAPEVTAFGSKMPGLRPRAEQELLVEREEAVATLVSIADGVVATDSEGHISAIDPAAECLPEAASQDLLGSYRHGAIELRTESSGERALHISKLSRMGLRTRGRAPCGHRSFRDPPTCAGLVRADRA